MWPLGVAKHQGCCKAPLKCCNAQERLWIRDVEFLVSRFGQNNIIYIMYIYLYHVLVPRAAPKFSLLLCSTPLCFAAPLVLCSTPCALQHAWCFAAPLLLCSTPGLHSKLKTESACVCACATLVFFRGHTVGSAGQPATTGEAGLPAPTAQFDIYQYYANPTCTNLLNIPKGRFLAIGRH